MVSREESCIKELRKEIGPTNKVLVSENLMLINTALMH